MQTRRQTLQALAGASTLLPFAGHARASALTPLSWRAFTSSEAGFLRAPVLVWGQREAVLIDAGFTYSDGRRLVDAIRRTGTRLTTVYVSVNDPDYYFNLPVIHQAFPTARILAAQETVSLIQSKAQGKLAAWSPKLGAEGPQTAAELLLPTPSSIDHLEVDGHRIEIVNTPSVNDRGRYLWAPSLQAVFGGALTFGGMYPWVADTPSLAQRNAWIAALDSIAARRPRVVVPGHMRADWPMDPSGLSFTRDYLTAFNEEDRRTSNAAELIAGLRKRFPDQAMPISLELGAKVAKHEMSWG